MHAAPPRTFEVKLYPKQLEVLQAREREVYLIAGAGFGKTVTLFWWVMDRLMRNPPRTAMMVIAPTYPVLRQSTQRRFFDELDERGIPYTRNKSENTCTIHGRTIFFRSADNPASLIGADLVAVAFDEAAHMERMAYVRGIQRLRDPRAVFAQALLVTTPEGTKTWVYEREQMPDVRVVRASTLENLSLTKETIDGLRSTYANDPAGWRQYVEGIATDLTGNIYTNLSAANVCEYGPPEQGDQLVVGWDFNVRNMASVVGMWRQRTETLHIVGEHITETVNGITTREHAEALKQILLDSGAARMGDNGLVNRFNLDRVRAFIDASGRAENTATTWTDELAVRNAGFSPRAPASNPLVRDRIATVQHALSTRRLLIDGKRAPKTLRSLREHSRDKNGEPQKRWNTGDFQADHACDAVGYMVCGLIPMRLERRW